MSNSKSDPRIFFASERTLLAWVRTGIAIIGLGFVVSRFGLFVRLIIIRQSGESMAGLRHSLSGILGITFVLIGALAVILAAVQHHRFVATLAPQDLPKGYSKYNSVLFALAIGVLGALLAVYLFFTPPHGPQ